jgi:hypothetical protein
MEIVMAERNVYAWKAYSYLQKWKLSVKRNNKNLLLLEIQVMESNALVRMNDEFQMAWKEAACHTMCFMGFVNGYKSISVDSRCRDRDSKRVPL